MGSVFYIGLSVFYFSFCFKRFSLFKFSLYTASLTEIQSRPNANVTLPCNVTWPSGLFGDDQSLISISWFSNGSAIASFRNATPHIKEGYSWEINDFVNGDLSLTILRASLDLQGLYECKVDYNSTMLHFSNVTFSILGMCLGL